MNAEQFLRPEQGSTAHQGCRVFAIEIRSQRVGYVIVEQRKHLIDWGVRTFPHPESSSSRDKLSGLFASLRPTMIIVSSISRGDHRDIDRARSLIRLIRGQARTLSISIQSFSKSSIKSHFTNAGHPTKHEIARLVADTFPELAWHLPRKRKAWQSESSSQLIFDATTLAIFYFAKEHVECGAATVWSAPSDE